MRKSIPVFTIAFIALMVALPVQSAGSSPLVHASAARAFGVRVHVATPLGDPSLTIEPTPFASAADPSVDAVTESVLGPLRAPEDGTLVGDARALVAEAARTLTPKPASHAEAVVTSASLFETAGVPLIAADLVHASSDTTCTSPSSAVTSAAGSRLVGLSIAGEIIDETLEPNTEIPLVYDNGTPADASDDVSVRVILNEQVPAAHGYGLIVTMIHAIVSTPADAGRIFADIRIAEAFSTAYCGEAGPRPVRVIDFDKVVTHTDSDPQGALDDGIATAHRGETVTWTVDVTNTSQTGCMLSTVTDSLPPHFGFVRTAGAFDDIEPALSDQDVVWEPQDQLQLNPGQTITQTITTRVAADAPYGTYTNLFGVFESSCSEASSGLMGPVTIVPKPATTVLSKPKTTPPAPGPLAATGVPVAPLAAASVALVMAAHVARALRRTRID